MYIITSVYSTLQEDFQHSALTYPAHQNSRIMSKYDRIPMIEETIINTSGSASGELSWKNEIYQTFTVQHCWSWLNAQRARPVISAQVLRKGIRLSQFPDNRITLCYMI